MTPSLALLCVSAGATLVAFGLYKLAELVYKNISSPLQNLPGPPSSSWVYGNFREILQADPSVVHEKWVEQYGQTFKYAGLGNVPRLFTLDTKALAHILSHTDTFQKSKVMRDNICRIAGPGMFVVEGDTHKLQRKILNPAFGPAQIRALTDIFVAKALQLRDAWTAELASAGVIMGKDDNGQELKQARVDVHSGLNRATLDIIGSAGFNYEFNALSKRKNELSDALAELFNIGGGGRLMLMLQGRIPLLRAIPTARKRSLEIAQKTMDRIGRQLILDAKADLVAAEKNGASQGARKNRDLFSLLLRANVSTDGKRLSDEDVLAQIPTFFLAGHDTTSSAVTWALFQLTQSPDVQAKLRAELRSVDTETPDMDELNALPYLDKVVREVMRVHPPGANTGRNAVRDDIIPLAQSFVDRNGVEQHEIRIRKGDGIFIPILAINRSKALWGEDAHEFKYRPDRWDNLPESVANIPGIWAHQLTFLAGPRACIGYRFSLIEIKAILFTLVRTFQFELAVPVQDVKHVMTIVQRPVLASDPDGGNQMPLLLKLARDEHALPL
ncbi:hypothetical protein PLICRDRAFT_135746 [Plicaturopsis crispa FD-325 SS-3]|nr:hypothetical protein PLICRDRAFT_135746 [Plicaturopsis crispa FD-325 SS-3]